VGHEDAQEGLSVMPEWVAVLIGVLAALSFVIGVNVGSRR
jgi:hypothetical protein